MFENFFHAGSLEFPAEVIDHVARDRGERCPTVVDVLADRPAILEPIVECAAAVTLNWGASAAALLDVLTGAAEPQGRLPFDLPRSMAAVAASRPDVPFDTVDPLFRFGHGAEPVGITRRRASRQRGGNVRTRSTRNTCGSAAVSRLAVAPRELVHVEHELHRVVDATGPPSSPSARR